MLESVIGSIHKCLISDKDGSFGVKVVSKLVYPIVDQVTTHSITYAKSKEQSVSF